MRQLFAVVIGCALVGFGVSLFFGKDMGVLAGVAMLVLAIYFSGQK
jgi:4-hydroxybenzoate polyprenyltransferase